MEITRQKISNKHKMLSPYPYALELETTTTCSVEPPCIMCVRNRERGGGNLPDNVLNEIKPYWRYLRHASLHGIGEAFFYPRLEELIQMSKNCQVGFTTGGHLLNEERIKFIVDNNLDYLSISIDAATEETHNKIRNTGFKKIIDNIILLQEYKHSQGKSYPRLIMNAVLMEWNIREASQIVKLAWELDAIHITFSFIEGSNDWEIERNGHVFNYREQKMEENQELHDIEMFKAHLMSQRLGGIPIDDGNYFFDFNKVKNMGIDIEIGFVQKRVPSTKHFPDNSKKLPEVEPYQNYTGDSPLICSRPWETMWVNLAGDVKFCCHQYDSLGNLQKEDFNQIWFGDKAREMRECFLQGCLPELCSKSKNICFPRRVRNL
jgi:MoaA/NifB/PqqE/SkfB family radical SAM enzyme